MNKSLIQKTLILLSCFSLFITILNFKETYGKYVTDIQDSTNIKIARWRILLNEEDVRNISTTSSVITPIFINNSNIKDNVIAPNAEGYFDLIIDGSEADVSFKYDINIQVNELSPVKDIVVTGYKIGDGELTETNEENIIGIVPFDLKNKVLPIRVYIMWDDLNGSMDNEADTLSTLSENGTKLDVSITFTQIR